MCAWRARPAQARAAAAAADLVAPVAFVQGVSTVGNAHAHTTVHVGSRENRHQLRDAHFYQHLRLHKNKMASMAAGTASNATSSMYMLQWHEHHASFFRLMEDLCREQSLTDVTITCGEVSLEAHSLILGASSPILR